jgi:tetratricopeptide (TPR) repeat protein
VRNKAGKTRKELVKSYALMLPGNTPLVAQSSAATELRRSPRSVSPVATEVPDDFIRRLKTALIERHISDGLALLESYRDRISSIGPATRNAGVFAGYLAQWVDAGFDGLAELRALLAALPGSHRTSMSLTDYVYLRMADGMLAMADEEVENTQRHFDFLLAVGGELGDREMLAVANFWKGRCYRKNGQYDQSLESTVIARELAVELGHECMAAVMRTLESWLYFQKGKVRDALRTLREAETVLQSSDDFITLGNLYSSYGRIARRDGRLEQAVRHFRDSIDAYSKRDPEHRNVARSLANMAHAERLIASQLREKVDAEAARRRRSGFQDLKPHQPPAAPDPFRERLLQVLSDAALHLDEAARIYKNHPNNRGAGTVHINCAHLRLDNGDLDRAAADAVLAYELGREKGDWIVMSRARILEAMIENARFEEQIDEPSHHAQQALEFAREAVELAQKTQNRRLRARALVALGMTYANDFFNQMDNAQQAADEAAGLLKPEGRDPLWQSLQKLKAQLSHVGAVDAKLRAWTQGIVEDKTFQQVTEEFAQLVIPKVWEREGRKVSRVATRLSISPKKVRRILNKAGLLGLRGDESEGDE